MKKLRNAKDYFKCLNRAELGELRTAINLQIYLLSIQRTDSKE